MWRSARPISASAPRCLLAGMSSQIGKKSVHHCSGASAMTLSKVASAAPEARQRSFGVPIGGQCRGARCASGSWRRRAAWRLPRLARGLQGEHGRPAGRRAGAPKNRLAPAAAQRAICDERHRLVGATRPRPWPRRLRAARPSARCRRASARNTDWMSGSATVSIGAVIGTPRVVAHRPGSRLRRSAADDDRRPGAARSERLRPGRLVMGKTRASWLADL